LHLQRQSQRVEKMGRVSQAWMMATLTVAALALAACAHSAGPSAAAHLPSTTTIAAPTTTAPRPPHASSAEDALLVDLSALNTAYRSAGTALTTMKANKATKSNSYTAAQVNAAIAPTAGALTTAINQLTAVIPTLPADRLLTQLANGLLTGLTKAQNSFHATLAISNTFAQAGAAGGSAAVSNALTAGQLNSLIRGYQMDVTSVNSTVTDFESNFEGELSGDLTPPQ